MKTLTTETQTPRGTQRKAGESGIEPPASRLEASHRGRAPNSEPGTRPGGNPEPVASTIRPSIALRPARDSMAEVHGPPLLLTQQEAAHLLGVDHTTVYRYERDGRMPPAVQVPGGRRKWRRADLESWVAMGFPSAREWEARKDQLSAQTPPGARTQRKRGGS